MPRWSRPYLTVSTGLRIAALLLLAAPHADAAEPAASGRDYSSELPRVAPLEVDQALNAFQVAAGFELQLVAAEPLVTDPVAMAFDESGRLYVAEMIGYSENSDDLLGRIRLLEDRDNDGRYDEEPIPKALCSIAT